MKTNLLIALVSATAVMALSASGASYPGVRAGTDGKIYAPSTFFRTNVLGGTNMLVTANADGSITLNVIGGGGGWGGSDFIASVSADFEVLAAALSLTNTSGTGAILRASTLGPYLTTATAESTYQPKTLTLTRLGGIGLGSLGDWLYRDASGWTNISTAIFESTLEGVLDLQDMQGAVTDAQVPNSITVDNATTAATANAGDSATAFFSSGQIERARGGTGADTSAYGAGLIGSDGTNNTIDVDTESELETALGGVDVVTVTSGDVTSANLRTAVSDETGTGALVFAGGDIGAATVTDDAYDATAWNGSSGVPSKNAIRDKIESMGSGGVSTTPRTNTWSGFSISTDASQSSRWRVLMTNASTATLSVPSNATDGQDVRWEIQQDSTGGRLLSLGSGWQTGTDITGITLSTNAHAVDYLLGTYNSVSNVWRPIAFTRGYR